MLNKFLLILLLWPSCSSLKGSGHYKIEFRENLAANKCEEAQNQVPLEKNDTGFLRFYQGTIGNAAYVSTVPITLGMDFLLMFRCQYVCPEANRKPFLEVLFPTSMLTYESSKDMRCPDTSYYVEKVLEIAECYARRGDALSLKIAVDQLNFVVHEYNRSGPSCLKIRDYEAVVATLDRLTNSLVKLSEKNSVSSKKKKVN